MAQRRVILSERGNFPTDLYMAQGLIDLTGAVRLTAGRRGISKSRHRRPWPAVAVLMLTHVNFQTVRCMTWRR
jgi:kynureninase